MKKILISIFLLIAIGSYFLISWLFDEKKQDNQIFYNKPLRHSFYFQSIDTMKYSRDLSRQKLNDPDFDGVIDMQMQAIADTGATHVAISTPYDDEFLPMLKRWVFSARSHGLKVWFRGNWSGWEGWFDYPKIGRKEHMIKTQKFILNNPNLFQDGDAFSSCPECENGGPGDPRMTGDVVGYRNFIISEYKMMELAFYQIHKNVRANLFSSNGDVAALIMDKQTTRALDGIVTVDHYVKTPEQLVNDMEKLAISSGGKVILGEFGVPIPDLQGKMTQEQQAKWITAALEKMRNSKEVYGINYWLNVGGSTEIWNSSGIAKEAALQLKKYYKPNVIYGYAKDSRNRALVNVSVKYNGSSAVTDASGYYFLSFVGDSQQKLIFSKKGYISKQIDYIPSSIKEINISMDAEGGWMNKTIIWLKQILASYN